MTIESREAQKGPGSLKLKDQKGKANVKCKGSDFSVLAYKRPMYLSGQPWQRRGHNHVFSKLSTGVPLLKYTPDILLLFIALYGCLEALGIGPVTCYLILMSSYRRLLRYYACVRRRPLSHLITLNQERIE